MLKRHSLITSTRMKLLYRIVIKVYALLIWLLQPFNAKAKLWIKGRKNIWQTIQLAKLNKQVVWFHVSSLGEFEQGRPLIEEIKRKYPGVSVVLTFFSPSGYEIRKNYPLADAVFYLPIDSPKNAKMFYDYIQPKLVVFVKYDFWNYYIQEAKQRNIPIILISAVFKPEQVFFKWYGRFYRKMLCLFSQIFVQDEQSFELLRQIGVQSIVAGDTRCDRVIQIAENPLLLSEVQGFINGRYTIVLGSLWNDDLQVIKEVVNRSSDNIAWIIAPHNIEPSYITMLEQQITLPRIRFSELNDYKSRANVLMVDNIGKLSSLYQFAKIAYIGGGFGKGIHNTLEPAVYGIPVVFGPKYHKFNEAIEMINKNAAFVVKNTMEAKSVFYMLIHDEEKRQQAAKAAFNYIRSKAGATKKIMTYVETILS